MNSVDKKFIGLVEKIKRQSLEDVYYNIRIKFNKIGTNIQKSLEDYFNKFPYWGKINKDEGDFEELYNRAITLKKHIDDFEWLYEKLGDYRSKKILYAILSNWYEFNFEDLNSCGEKNYAHYFDLDLVKCNEKEVIVDLGAYVGDTILDYLDNYGVNNYSKIYCYEITDESFFKLQNNLKHYPNINFIRKAVSNVVGTSYISRSEVDESANMISDRGDESVPSVTLDEDIKERVTMIKMDIEGSEQKAIEGAKAHIINDHPKLLISVYHNHDDLWKIPKMIEDIQHGYKFYLRYYGNNVFPTETVLIAKYDVNDNNLKD